MGELTCFRLTDCMMRLMETPFKLSVLYYCSANECYRHTISEAVDGLDFLRIMGCNMSNIANRATNPNSESPSITAKTALWKPLPPTPFNVILLDDNMPNMNGSEAVEIIRQHGYRGLIVVISGNLSCKERFKKKGVDDVLSKPIDVDQLKTNIEQFLRAQRTHSSVATNDY